MGGEDAVLAGHVSPVDSLRHGADDRSGSGPAKVHGALPYAISRLTRKPGTANRGSKASAVSVQALRKHPPRRAAPPGPGSTRACARRIGVGCRRVGQTGGCAQNSVFWHFIVTWARGPDRVADGGPSPAVSLAWPRECQRCPVRMTHVAGIACLLRCVSLAGHSRPMTEDEARAVAVSRKGPRSPVPR
jgi:hypothetical protein